MFDDTFDTPVHDNLLCTKKDAMILLYTYYVRHTSSWEALSDLGKLINSILGHKALPTSKYMFKKLFTSQNSSTVHLMCINCNKYLGKKNDFGNENEIICDTCNRPTKVVTKYQKNYFITLEVEDQLKKLVEANIESGHFDIEKCSVNRVANDDITDVHDSENFKKIKSRLQSKSITLTVSTDGVVVQKATKEKSLWPVQFFVNEIKLNHRFKRENMMVASLAFGKIPDMASLMRPFIQEINEINRKGGISVKVGDSIEKFLVIVAIFTADSVAKCYVAAKTQHNSHYGCPYCEHEGTRIANTTHLKYCIRDNTDDRCDEEVRSNMLEAYTSGQIIKGYRGISPLLALDFKFDVVSQFVIDHMHSDHLGVRKKFFNILVDRENKDKE